MREFYQNKLFLAPMAGITDLAFRTVCKECGADLVVSEMVSSRGLHYDDKKTGMLLMSNETERPLIVQLFGNEPEVMAESAKKLQDMGVLYLDINMGCPAPKIVKNGDGSALMKDELLAGKVAESVVRAVKIPVSVKFRAGWDAEHINAVSFAKTMENAGVSAVCVHGRTKEQFYSGTADYEIIRQVKEAVSIPVIGNGDVIDGESAQRLIRETGCDSIMIGRGAQGNPYVFQTVKRALAGLTDEALSLGDKQKIMLRHIALMAETKPEHVGVPEMRKHFAWYLKGIKNATKLKVRAFSAKSYTELTDMVYEMTE